MTKVRLDTTTKAALKRSAIKRGQTNERLQPFVGIADSGGQQLSTDTGRRFREALAKKHRAAPF